MIYANTQTTDCISANTDSSLIFILTGDVGSDHNRKNLYFYSIRLGLFIHIQTWVKCIYICIITFAKKYSGY